jgi:hypothetical protein
MRRLTDRKLHLGPTGLRDSAVRAPRSMPVGLIVGLMTFSVIVVPTRAGAAGDSVTNCSGSATEAGSLPFVIGNAVSGETIDFSTTCPPSSPIVLSSTLDIDVDLAIDGPGPATMAVSGNGAATVLAVAAGATTTIAGITIEDGLGQTGGGIDTAGSTTVTNSTITDNSSSDGGGGIASQSGSLTVTDSTVSDNSTYRAGGGGIETNGGSALVTDSVLSDDSAYNGGITIGGGGIENNGATVSVIDTTFARDVSDYNGGGGGVFNDEGTVDLTESTLAHNVTHRQGGGGGGNIENEFGTVSVAGTIVSNTPVTEDCSGVVTDAGYNLDDDGSCGFSETNHSQSDVNPYLGPLQDNGGPTESLAPALGSPVLNQIPSGASGNGQSLCPGTDQRGVARPQGSACDIGSVELSPTAETITSHDAASATVHAPLSFTVTTSGTPTPSITKSGRLPKRLRFVDNGNGTATLSGVPRTAGTYRVVIKATFGGGPSAFVVTQVFTLTVGS